MRPYVALSNESGSKLLPTSLKASNQNLLAIVLIANLAVFYLLASSGALLAGEFRALIDQWQTMLPAALVLVLVGIANAQLSPLAKARVVFWRWLHPLPGAEAFTTHGPADARVDMAALAQGHGPLPTDPAAQNKLWYRLYKTVENEPSVLQAHREYLFARDYAAIALLLVPLLGAAGFVLFDLRSTAIIYVALLVIQYLLVQRAASGHGVSLVTNVLALKGAGA